MNDVSRLFLATLLRLVLLVSPQMAQAAQAYLLDTSSLRNVDDLYLLGTLQGIVNRDAPRLFLTGVNSSLSAGANEVYAQYLQKEKGFTFTRFTSLGDAISTFASMKRADGVTPLIRGLIKYPTHVVDTATKRKMAAYYNYWIAANFAAQEDLLPVSESVLQCLTPALSGSEFWHKDNQMKGWEATFSELKRSPEGGLTVNVRPGLQARFVGYASRFVHLDLDQTPKIEIVVSDLTPGRTWSLGIRMATVVNTMESSACVKVPGLTGIDRTGTFVVDLASTGLFIPRSGMARLQIMPHGQGTEVTVKSIRLLDAQGEDPQTLPYVPPRNIFDGLAIKRDLTTNAPYAQDEEKACAWSLANQRKLCNPRAFGSFAGGAWILKGLDYVIAKKIYLFYQNKEPIFKGGYPNLDLILADLKPPGLVFGWLGAESPACMKMGQYGARYAGGPPENFSFWQWVPLNDPGKPVPLPAVREVQGLQNKTYLNFSWASADYISISYDLMDGFWQDPDRGKIPMTWGFNPLIALYAPALVEFYARTATPRDSFWGFTAGYTHTSCFPPEALRLYAEETRQGLARLGISPAVDVWDSVRHASPVYEELSRNSSTAPGIKLMTLLPSSRGPEISWLDNGATVLRMDELFHGKSQKNGGSTVESIVAGVKQLQSRHQARDPLFLTCNTRIAPSLALKVQEQLPANVQIVGMPDFIALAEESGALVALPFSTTVGSGDQLKVRFELHNASGKTGKPGEVTWTLPAGWTSSPSNWAHGPVPLGSNLKQVVTFTPPEGMTTGKVSVVYKDSRFPWEKEFFITTCSRSVTISDGDSLAGWTSAGAATLSMDRGMLKITPANRRSRADFFSEHRAMNDNGRITIPLGNVDFNRNPLLVVNIPDQDGAGTVLGLLDEKGEWKRCAEHSDVMTLSVNLPAVTKWRGTKEVSLTIDPLTHFGSMVRIRSIKLCYP